MGVPVGIALIAGGIVWAIVAGWSSVAFIAIWLVSLGFTLISICRRFRPVAFSDRIRVEKMDMTRGRVSGTGTPGVLIPPRPWTGFRNVVVAAMLLLGGPAFYFMREPGTSTPTPMVMCACVLTVGGIVYILLVIPVRGSRGPQLHLSEQGVLLHDNISFKFTRWDDLDSAVPVTVRQRFAKTGFIAMTFRPGVDRSVTKNRPWLWNMLIQFGRLHISLVTFDIDSALLLNALDWAIEDEPGWRAKLGTGAAINDMKLTYGNGVTPSTARGTGTCGGRRSRASTRPR